MEEIILRKYVWEVRCMVNPMVVILKMNKIFKNDNNIDVKKIHLYCKKNTRIYNKCIRGEEKC